MRFTLRRRLLLLVGLGLLPAFVIVASSQLSSRALRLEEIDAYALQMTEVASGEVIRGMTGAPTLMVAAGRSPALAEPGSACDDYLAAIRGDIPSILDAAVAAPAGQLTCHSGVSGRGDLQSAIDRLVVEPLPGALRLGSYTSTPVGPALPMSLSQADEAGVVQRHFMVNVSLTELEQLLSNTSEAASGATTVADVNGIVLLSKPEGRFFPGEPLPGELLSLASEPEPGTVKLEIEGESRIVGYRPASPAFPLAVFYDFSEDAALAPIDAAAVTNSLIAIGGAVAVFVISWLVGETIIHRPVSRIGQAIAARRTGDKSSRTGLANGSELEMIGQSIDQYFDELDRREADQTRAEEQRDMHAREVQHRVKNLLTVIHVIARQTLARPDASVQVQAFADRIDVMVRANKSILEGEDLNSELHALVVGAVQPFLDEEDFARLRIEGPELQVQSRPGTAIAVALHELATNAVKHGALSSASGQVTIRWRVLNDLLLLSWEEAGGPSVEIPIRTGFGSVLIGHALEVETGGKVTTEFRPEGFRFELAAPINGVLA